MNKYSSISDLRSLYAEKVTLQRQVYKQEKTILNDLSDIQSGAQRWVDGVFRLKNIVKALLPKFEFASILYPIVKRFVFRRKRK